MFVCCVVWVGRVCTIATRRQGRRSDGKFGWECLQCAASAARVTGAELEDVERQTGGQVVDVSKLAKHQKLVHDEAYCSLRWGLVKTHCTANPSDRWMCVALSDAEYAAAKERDTSV